MNRFFLVVIVAFTAFACCFHRHADATITAADISRVKSQLKTALGERRIPDKVNKMIAILQKHLYILNCLPTKRIDRRCHQTPNFCTIPKLELFNKPIGVKLSICKRPWVIKIDFYIRTPWWAKVRFGSIVIPITTFDRDGVTKIDSYTSGRGSDVLGLYTYKKASISVKGLIRWDCTKPGHNRALRVRYNRGYNKVPQTGSVANRLYYKLHVRVEVKTKKFWCMCYRCKAGDCKDVVNTVGYFGRGPESCNTDAREYDTYIQKQRVIGGKFRCGKHHRRYLLCIQIHKADRLKPDINVHHPCVRVHIVDKATGQYVKKSDRTRNVASLYEGENQLVDFIMPVITQPFDFRKQRSMLPCWEDVLLYNEIYSYFLQREQGDPEVIIFFEIIDFLSARSVTRGKMPGADQGWYKIAWAFLKVVSATGSCNTDKKVRLQLYQPPTRFRARNPLPGSIEVFQWWKFADRTAYPSTLYVTVKGIRPPDDLGTATRSMYPIQQESGRITFEELNNTLDGMKSRKRDSVDKKIQIWDRLPGQTNRIPNKLSLILPTGRQGCSVARFSPDGRALACACAGIDGYPILVYEIPSGSLQGELSGHFGIVYDMSWTTDRELVTASSDGTVRSWDADRCVGNAIKIYPHPSFVYSAKHHPSNKCVIVSGGYDKVVRIWSKTTDNLYGKLIRELPGHHGFINSITFQPTGDQMYTADSCGVIIIWKCSLPETKKKRQSKALSDEEVIKGWRTLQTIKLEEIRNTPINSLKLHPSGRKLLVHSRDAFIRMLDLRSSAVMKRYLGALNTKEHIRSTTSACGNFVISGSEDGTVHVWNTETGDPVYHYNDLGFTNAVSDVDFHPHENMIVCCSFGVGHPVLVYVFDIEVQMKAARLNETAVANKTTDELSYTLGDTSASMLAVSQQRPSQNYAADGSGSEREKHRADRVRQKLDTLLNSADFSQSGAASRANAAELGETTKTRGLAETLHSTWGSDFSTYLPTTTQARFDLPTASPHALQHLGASSRFRSQSQNSDAMNMSAARQSPSRSSYFGAIEAQMQDSPLTMSQLHQSRKPVFSFNTGSSQKRMSPQKKKVTALYPHQPDRADELAIKPNDVITVLFKDNDWWIGEMPDGRQGYFPAYVVMEQEEDLEEVSTTTRNDEDSRNYHSAVVSKDGNLKIISGPEDSEVEARFVQAASRFSLNSSHNEEESKDEEKLKGQMKIHRQYNEETK
eukprot:gene4725-5348_t